jgi:hypothetical protein
LSRWLRRETLAARRALLRGTLARRLPARRLLG